MDDNQDSIDNDNNDYHNTLETLDSIDCKGIFEINDSLKTIDQTFQDLTRSS